MKISKLLGIIAIALALLLVYSFFIPVFKEEKVSVAQIEKKISLPQLRYSGNISVEEAILNRRSVREYSEETLTLEELSQLLWAAQGITSREGFRTAPSAGALYPLEIYVVTVEGIFHYLPLEHSLEQRYSGDVRKALAKASLDQEWVANAPVNMVIAGVFERTTKKYGERGERYVYIEVGHAAQNVLLECVSLNLGAVVVGAFYDEQVKEVLHLPEGHIPLYIIPVGRKVKE